MFSQLSQMVRRARAAQHKMALLQLNRENILLHEQVGELPHHTFQAKLALDVELSAADLGLAVVDMVGETDPKNVVVLTGEAPLRIAAFVEASLIAAYNYHVDYPGTNSARLLAEAMDTVRMWGQTPELVIGAYLFNKEEYFDDSLFVVARRERFGVGRMEAVEGMLFTEAIGADIEASVINAVGLDCHYEVSVVTAEYAEALTEKWNAEMLKDATQELMVAS